MGKTKNEGNKTPTRYRPFYPTTVGPNLHDVTFQKFPSFSLRLKPNPIDKRCSPGPAAYPGDLSFIGNMKHRRIRSIYPTDKGYVYSMRIKG
ncbi:hypothetical protein Bhyg_06966 [Pseudolycoriella hygida]|uniref:Uncharacterized protein n=1 Tax=Pseudolycoriella hygida TaxID=35572 RepID=A0A9Q0N1P7_9DIPT|nr:hypothetical protein Bhyg_06966 [Pseudolycoriella hygida]